MKKISFSAPAWVTPLIEKVSKLTKGQRIGICVGVFVLILAPMIYFVYMPMHEQITQLTGEYETLTAELEKLKEKAKQIEKYRAEMKEIEAQFEIARQALPEKEEIPALLTNISRAAQDSGLDIILFRPEKEIESDFYAEIPVTMKVFGRYHNAAIFFDKISRLSRIVSIRDIVMSEMPAQAQKKDADRDKLDISWTAVTYKFIEPAPAPPAPPAAAPPPTTDGE